VDVRPWTSATLGGIGADAGIGMLLACRAVSGFVAGAWASAVTNCGIETDLA
jgi:hypothetical protein